ncbi:MAG: hypothetical protein J3R72DRAFT_455760 [Linnemannia gamsii]|nr:MAG: hypothetical protein J3R72DRAFT_455760 [Linnemannia gamsii]
MDGPSSTSHTPCIDLNPSFLSPLLLLRPFFSLFFLLLRKARHSVTLPSISQHIPLFLPSTTTTKNKRDVLFITDVCPLFFTCFYSFYFSLGVHDPNND